MNREIAEAIDELRRAFAPSTVTVTEDGGGGAYVVVEEVELGHGFEPGATWMGGHIPSLYPAADIYPVFIDAAVRRASGAPFDVPITMGHSFQGRTAIQVSRRNNQIHLAPQSARAKFVKIVDYLRNLP